MHELAGRKIKDKKQRRSTDSNHQKQTSNSIDSDNLSDEFVGNNQLPREFPIVKSPSDSTLYTPALHKEVAQNNAVNQISNFVENIRFEQVTSSKTSTPERGRNHQVRSQVVQVRRDDHSSTRHSEEIQNAKQITDKILLDAE